MRVRSISSPHAKHIDGSFEIGSDGRMVRVITVQTDLKLNAADPAHDKEAVDELLAQLQASMGDLYDRADLKQSPDA